MHNVDNKYEWKEDIPYNTDLAIEALDNEEISDSMKAEHMALLKNFKLKLENNNVHFEQAFAQQSTQLQTIIRVLDMQ